MFWRPTAVEDLEPALAIDPYSRGDEIVGRSRMLAAYQTLVRTRRFLSAVVELPLPNGTRRIVGFGGATFVSESFFRQEISNPRPGLNARIVASLTEDTPAVLTHDEIRRANTYDGLNVVITHASLLGYCRPTDEPGQSCPTTAVRAPSGPHAAVVRKRFSKIARS